MTTTTEHATAATNAAATIKAVKDGSESDGEGVLGAPNSRTVRLKTDLPSCSHGHQLPPEISAPAEAPPRYVVPKKQFVTYVLYTLIALAFFHSLVLYPAPASEKSVVVAPVQDEVAAGVSARVHAREQLLLLAPPQQGDEVLRNQQTQAKEVPAPCDYSDGEWVPDPRSPLYNGTSCGTITDRQNCMAHDRPDTAYLYWRWRPRRCDLPIFSPDAFLIWFRNKHLAFVGDSLTRNQAESLLCLLASRSVPELVYRDGGEETNRFRRFVFREHNATVSVFWSPFLVKAERAAAGVRHKHNKYNVFLDAFDERWMSQLGALDAIVLSVGHWFLVPRIYHDGGSIVRCHDFFGVFKTAIHRTLAEVIRRHGDDDGDGDGAGKKVVALTTFSPAHFEGGEWDKGGACPKKLPYRNGEKELGYTETEMRTTVVEAVQQAAAGAGSSGLRFVALDVTTLANLRPDGHPGPYMHKDPFVDGGTVQNDCVHWCLPGLVDTFNEILLQNILR